MGFLDALTGDAGHQAAANSRMTLASIIPNLATTGQDAYRNAGDLLGGGFSNARTDLGQGYGASTGAINAGAGGALGYLDQGTQGALGQLGQARGDLTANGGAFAPLSALAQQYGQGAGLYADALGVNGPQGNQRAQGAFQAAPGFNFQLNTGLDAINRAQNARGMANSGNTDRSAQDYGMGVANQGYQQWLSNLAPYNAMQLQATQGAASGNQANNNTLATLGLYGSNLLQNQSGRQAQVAQGQGNSLSDLARQYFGGLAGNDVSGGAALAGNQIGGAQNYQNTFANALPQYNDTFKQDAKASTDASTNSLNLGMNLAKLAASAAGGGMFGGAGAGGSSFMPSSAFMNNQWGW